MKLKKPALIVGILLGMMQFGCQHFNLPPIIIGIPTPAPTEVTIPSPSAASPSASPSSTAEPRLTPQPTASSIPRPTGSIPWNTTCSVPEHITPDHCVKTTPGEVGKYRKNVFNAMQTVFNKYPWMFYNKGTQACPWEIPTVENQDLFYWNVELELKNIYHGFCASFDGENIRVKLDNTYEEQYHPLRTDGDIPPSQCLSDINGIYVFHCAPAGF